MARVSHLRVGAVSYLNTKPLVHRLGEFASDAEVSFDLPSRLADQLANGQLDVALIPSVETLQDPSYTVISDACIACRGPVLSVKLLSRVPVPQIRSLALDEGSRTSAAMVQILLRQQFDLRPTLVPLPIGHGASQASTDAVLLIGDRAIHPPRGEFVEEWDLGARWCQWSALPFVFAMWTARPGVEWESLAVALGKARDAGVEALSEIAEREAPALSLTTEACHSYLRDNLYFYLGLRERQGLNLFREQAAEIGLVPAAASTSSGVRFDGV